MSGTLGQEAAAVGGCIHRSTSRNLDTTKRRNDYTARNGNQAVLSAPRQNVGADRATDATSPGALEVGRGPRRREGQRPWRMVLGVRTVVIYTMSSTH